MTRLFRALLPATMLLATFQSHAVFHEWEINEVFSNGDGSIQYIELTTDLNGQGQLSGKFLVSSATGAGNTTLTFNGDLVGDTAGKSLLLATAGFADLTGLEPDFTLPSGFVPTRGGSLNFGEGASILTFSQEQFPLNGVQALNSDLQPVTPTPNNFADNVPATVATDTNATFDTGTNVMNVPVLDAPGIGLANVSFSVNLDIDPIVFTLLDNFYLYADGISGGNAPAQLQDGSVLYIPALEVGTDIYEFNLTIIGEDPIALSNLQVLSVTNQGPAPEPEPDPTPDPDQASISRGQTQFADQCASCHGASGGGGSGPNIVNSSLNTFDPLRSYINNSMPRFNPAACVDSGSATCATDVTNYVLNVIQGGSSASSSGDLDVGNY